MELDELQKIVGWLRDGGAEDLLDDPGLDDPWDLHMEPPRLLWLFLLAAEEEGEVTSTDIVRALGGLEAIRRAGRWSKEVVRAVRLRAEAVGALDD